MDENSIWNVEGLEFTPLSVLHGRNYYCLGFKFGSIVYLSDVSEIPIDVRKFLNNCQLLILDAVEMAYSHPTHFTLERALDEVRKFKPKKTYLIGMTHQFEHKIVNEMLFQLKNSEGIDVELSYDGLCLDVEL
jgi:phosphoribosyl 1,2-cyclic phosphodiesterase